MSPPNDDATNQIERPGTGPHGAWASAARPPGLSPSSAGPSLSTSLPRPHLRPRSLSLPPVHYQEETASLESMVHLCLKTVVS